MPIDFLLDRIRQSAGKEAFVWRDLACTYRWLDDRIAHWSDWLGDQVIAPGTAVGLAAQMSPESIAGLLALLARGLVAVPIVPANHPNWRAFFATAQCQLVVGISEDGPVVVERATQVVSQPLYETLRSRGAPGLVLFSSGTTGPSKAVVHDAARLLEKFVRRRHDLRTLAFMEFDHIGGQDTLMYALSNSSCLVLLDDRSPDAVCQAIERHRIEVLPSVPTFLALLALGQAYRHNDLSSVKFVTYGSELMSPAVLAKCREIFPNATLLQKYGATEVGTLRSASKNSESLWVKVGGEGYQTRVVDGMLEVKADSAMLGYLNAPSPFTDDGWFMTRDCVEVDGDYVRFLGRESDIINVGGRKVFPGDVEAVVRELPDIADVTVYGQPNPILGRIVCARITLSTAMDASAFRAVVKRHCMARLAEHQVPIVITVDGPTAHS